MPFSSGMVLRNISTGMPGYSRAIVTASATKAAVLPPNQPPAAPPYNASSASEVWNSDCRWDGA